MCGFNRRLCAALLVMGGVLALSGCGTAEPADTPAVTTAAPSTATTAAPTTVTPYPFVGYINSTTLNVRPSAGTAGIPIGGLRWGESVTVTGREGDWYQIRFGDGVGYIHAQYVQETPPVSTTATESTAAPDSTTAGSEAE